MASIATRSPEDVDREHGPGLRRGGALELVRIEAEAVLLDVDEPGIAPS